MDIVIKSFNRPYYLERCLRSIYKFVSGEFRVLILEDGTPPEYLAKIAELFPEVTIARSPLYDAKVEAIHDHVTGRKKYSQTTIPVAFWVDEIARCSDYFLLLEDDIWVTAPIALDEFESEMRAWQIAMVKLSWLGNSVLIPGEKRPINDRMEELVPAIPFLSDAIFLNKYRIRSVLYHLGAMRLLKSDFKYQLPYYSLYSVASAFFEKKYWLHLWDRGQTKVEEARQLEKAAAWFRATGSRYAKSTTEVTKTSFITSATNMFEGVKLDVLRFNHHVNQAWLHGQLDAMTNFPADFREEQLKCILDRAADPDTTYSEWLKWIDRFKEQYRRIGCETE